MHTSHTNQVNKIYVDYEHSNIQKKTKIKDKNKNNIKTRKKIMRKQINKIKK